jgi:hypothetical protein
MKDIVGKKTANQQRATVEYESTAGAAARHRHTVGLRMGEDLYATAENALEAAHLAGDYSLTSLPDLIRAALTAHFDGMALSAPPEKGRKRRTTIGMDDNLKARYDELPHGKRSEIVERSLRTFLNRGTVFERSS